MKNIRDELDKAVNVIKIEITREEKVQLAAELEGLIQWLEPLVAADTADTDQVLNCHGAVNAMREDIARPGELSELQKTASNFDDSLYRVPKIIE